MDRIELEAETFQTGYLLCKPSPTPHCIKQCALDGGAGDRDAWLISMRLSLCMFTMQCTWTWGGALNVHGYLKPCMPHVNNLFERLVLVRKDVA